MFLCKLCFLNLLEVCLETDPNNAGWIMKYMLTVSTNSFNLMESLLFILARRQHCLNRSAASPRKETSPSPPNCITEFYLSSGPEFPSQLRLFHYSGCQLTNEFLLAKSKQLLFQPSWFNCWYRPINEIEINGGGLMAGGITWLRCLVPV